MGLPNSGVPTTLVAMTDLQHVHSVDEAIARLIELYDTSCFLAKQALSSGNYEEYRYVTYPKIAVEVREWTPIDRSEPFGYVDES